MSVLATFLRDVLFEGRICLHVLPQTDDLPARQVLRHAYQVYRLSIAGPALPFEEETALAAARVLLNAAWYFLNSDLLMQSPQTMLSMPAAPRSPEQHLSADLLLRFVPALHRRAKALLPNDVLPQRLEQILRQWPLSGVLADIAEPPLTPIDFGEHAGLNFLYAERLAQQERPGWFPVGLSRQYVELVWQQMGKNVAVLQLQQAQG